MGRRGAIGLFFVEMCVNVQLLVCVWNKLNTKIILGTIFILRQENEKHSRNVFTVHASLKIVSSIFDLGSCHAVLERNLIRKGFVTLRGASWIP